MKRVLIIGKTSYAGRAIVARLSLSPGEYGVEAVSISDLALNNCSFAPFDVIVLVTGLVQQAKELDNLFASLNRGFAIEIAKKAKGEGVSKLILMSTMDVYGAGRMFRKTYEIGPDSRLKPGSPYGKTRLETETGVEALSDDSFKVCIIRAPMVYGEACDGNYRLLRRYVLRFGFIPDYNNNQSAIYIGNLCEYVRVLIDEDMSGVFCPRDIESFNTAAVMEWIARENAREYVKSGFLGACIKPASVLFYFLREVFGNLTYDPLLSRIPLNEYNKWNLRDAIHKTEEGFKSMRR